MGSFCDLRISGYSVIEQKYRIDPELLSIFAEADKVHAQHAPDSQGSDEDDEDLAFDGYCNTATAIAERLDLMGFTLEAARADFDLTLKVELHELQEKRDLDSVWSDQNPNEEFYATLRAENDKEIDFLSRLTFDGWVESMQRIRENPVQWKDYDAETASKSSAGN
jgi:hypothetical protein